MNIFSVSDGTIQKITSHPGKLSIEFKDWKEEVWILTFEDLVAFQSIGAEGEEIAEISMQESELINMIDKNDLEEQSKVTLFFALGTKKPVLTIIASNFKQVKL